MYLIYYKTIIFVDESTVYCADKPPKTVVQYTNKGLDTNIVDNETSMSLKLENENLDIIKYAKWCEFNIDQKLDGTKHIENCKKKVSSSLYWTISSQHEHVLSVINLRTLYYRLVHPHLTHGIVLWENA